MEKLSGGTNLQKHIIRKNMKKLVGINTKCMFEITYSLTKSRRQYNFLKTSKYTFLSEVYLLSVSFVKISMVQCQCDPDKFTVNLNMYY